MILKKELYKNVGKQNKELEKKKAELNISKDLEDIKKFNLTELIKLGENNIKNLDQLADLSSDELIEIFENKLKRKDADEIIMKAREHWFKEDKKKINNIY